MKMLSDRKLFVTLSSLLWAVSSVASDETCSTCPPYYGPTKGENAYGAVDIDPLQVTSLDADPLIVTIDTTDRQLLCNNGTKMTMYPIDNKRGSLSGGLACGNYTYYKTEYYWTGAAGNYTGSTFRNKGFEAETVLIYYNSSYSTCDDAVKAKSPFIRFVIGITIEGYSPDPYFDATVSTVKQVVECNKCVEILPTALQPGILSQYIADSTPYYVYSAYLYDADYDEWLPNSVILLSPTSGIPIAKQQFDETYLALKDCSGCPYTNSLSPNNTSADIPVYQARGVTLVNKTSND